jgi:hypothetical protein
MQDIVYRSCRYNVLGASIYRLRFDIRAATAARDVRDPPSGVVRAARMEESGTVRSMLTTWEVPGISA